MEMPSGQTASYLSRLKECGVVILPAAVPRASLERLATAAALCFESIDAARGQPVRADYRFTAFSSSVVVSALLDFGCAFEDLTAPIAAAGLDSFLADSVGRPPICNFDQSWIRKRYAPLHAPPFYRPNSWHQDGALGVNFPAEPGPLIPIIEMVTCWIPMNPCGEDSPGLEFVARRLEFLLHYTELGDSDLRRRFPPEEFRAPVLEPGDALIFLGGSLHRTYDRPEMRRDRLSVEYRFFPARPKDQK